MPPPCFRGDVPGRSEVAQMRDCERGEVLARRGQKAARRFAHELAQADPRLRSAAHRGPQTRIYDCDCERGEDLARRHQKAACRFSGGLQHESHVPRLAVLKKRFRTGCELLAGCRWTHSADEQKGPGDSQRTRARLRSLPSSCIRRGAACPYQIFACASAPRCPAWNRAAAARRAGGRHANYLDGGTPPASCRPLDGLRTCF